MDLQKAQSIFIIGIKGVAMANLAVIFKKMGKLVTGADISEVFITDSLLTKHDIPVINGFEGELPSGTQLVIYSAAHGGTSNKLAHQAEGRGIRVLSQAEILGELMGEFKTSIAVCGTHGKTTTSALLSYTLLKLGKNPSYLVGAPSFSGYEGADYLGKDFFVVEADEYGVNPPEDKTIKFLHLKPTHILATNIGYDHPDVFAGIGDVKRAFTEFFSFTPLTICVDDADLMDAVKEIPRSQYRTYGFSDEAQYRISNLKSSIDTSEFEIFEDGVSQGIFSTKLFGRKNISNAVGVYAVLRTMGVEAESIKAAIADFSGVKRRFELKGEGADRSWYLFDDYAHHPDEIVATIDAVRARFPGYTVGVIFQPHTYSRTKALVAQFAKSLGGADYAVVLPIFPSARENSAEFSVSSEDIQDSATKRGIKGVFAVASRDQLLSKLKELLGEKQVVVTMGAGDIYTLDRDIIELLKSTVK